MFVFNTFLIRMVPTKKNPVHMVAENIHIWVAEWQEILEVTGGALNSYKIFFLIPYKWVGGQPILQLSEYDIEDIVDINNT